MTKTITLPTTINPVVWTARDIKAMLKGLDTHERGDKQGLPLYDSCNALGTWKQAK